MSEKESRSLLSEWLEKQTSSVQALECFGNKD